MHLLVLITTPEMDDIPRHYAWVRVSSIVDHLSDVYRIALFIYLRYRHADLGKRFDIPQKYLRYACLIAADRKITKEADLEELKREEADKFISGFYYTKGFHYQRFEPEKVEIDQSFLHYSVPHSERLFNDCLVHAVNFALRHPWFTCREQVVRLMCKRMKKGDISVAQQFKRDGGVRINHMQNFLLCGNISDSL